MGERQIEIYWNGHLVGFLRESQMDMYHLYGKWIPADKVVADQFLDALRSALDRWEEDVAGVDVEVRGGRPWSGEVTGFSDGVMNVKISF